MIIETIYSLGEVVYIPSIELQGVLTLIQYGQEGLYYKVTYFANSVQRVAWVYDHEIRKIGKNDE